MTGLTQETCRDFVHTGYGISSISHVLETSRIQGIDLYPEFGERLRQALGFQSRWERNLEPVPSWLCKGTLKRGLGPITEVGYNALHTRLGIAMANTQALTESRRPAGSNNLFVAWETLTHAENPADDPRPGNPVLLRTDRLRPGLRRASSSPGTRSAGFGRPTVLTRWRRTCLIIADSPATQA